MTYTEAMAEVGAGRAVFSPSLGGTVLRVPRCENRIMFVPRVTGSQPIAPIAPFTTTLADGITDDWVLSGVKGKAGAV